ncbi:MAG: glycosyltransferase family 4 protein [Planctomycetota bacterium]
MRFLVLTQYFPPEIGAPQARLSSMVRELASLGHEVEIVTAMPNYPQGSIFPDYAGRFYRRDEWNGIPVHRVWLYAAMGAGVKRMINYGSFTATALYGLMRAKKPDYVFVESPPLFLSVPAWLASRYWGVPMIFNVADLWPDSIRELGLVREGLFLRVADRLEAWTYRRAAFVNTVTEGIRDTLRDAKHVPARKLLFMPNGVDTELFKPGRRDEALARELGLDGRKVILYAGTLGFAQGLDVAVDAMDRLQSDVPDAVLVFLGSGSDKSRLVEEVRSRGIGSVRFLDPVPLESVARMYSIAYAGFASLKDLPLFEGARPSKIFPIMASGKPVVYSGKGEGARLVEKAGAGLVTKPGDADALADAIRFLIHNPEQAEAMGRDARAFVEENCAWPALVRHWLNQLEERSDR